MEIRNFAAAVREVGILEEQLALLGRGLGARLGASAKCPWAADPAQGGSPCNHPLRNL